MPAVNDSKEMKFENNVGKEESAGHLYVIEWRYSGGNGCVNFTNSSRRHFLVEGFSSSCAMLWQCIFLMHLLCTKRQILDSSKLKDFADDNFKLDENGGIFFKWIENTVGKEKMLVMSNLFLYQRCFQNVFNKD